MDLRQLRYFHAVATHGGFRRASEALQIAQPALSAQIRRLEAELGAPLFDRTRRPVALTPAGERLREHADRLLTEVAAVQADMQAYVARQATLRVGTLQYLTLLDVPAIMERFRAGLPETSLTMAVGNTGELEDLLLNGDLDVAITHRHRTPNDDRLLVQPLRSEGFAVALARSHPMSGRPDVAVGELAGARFVSSRPGGVIRERFREQARAAGYDPEIAFETADLATTFSLVGRDFGVAIVPRSIGAVAPEQVVVLPLRDTPPLTVCLISDGHRRPPELVRAFAAFAATAFTARPV